MPPARPGGVALRDLGVSPTQLPAGRLKGSGRRCRLTSYSHRIACREDEAQAEARSHHATHENNYAAWR
jgi:hypothetical protein